MRLFQADIETLQYALTSKYTVRVMKASGWLVSYDRQHFG